MLGNMKKIYFILIGLIFIAGCAYTDNTTKKESVPLSEEVTNQDIAQNAEEPKEDSKIKEFEITAKTFEFNPDTIRVNKGDKVKLIIKSTDVTHGFEIKEYNIEEILYPNKPVTVEFIADKAGEFIFKCNIPCGSGHSIMAGKLIVE